MTTNLNALQVGSTVNLTADVLGEVAANVLMTALQLDTDIALTACQVALQNAKVLIITLADFGGRTEPI